MGHAATTWHVCRDLNAGQLPDKSDGVLLSDPALAAIVDEFAADETAFHAEYASALQALSELGTGLSRSRGRAGTGGSGVTGPVTGNTYTYTQVRAFGR